MDFECVVEMECETGEGPLWHPGEGVLYFVDIPRGHLYCYDPDTGETERVREGGRIGGLGLHEDGSLILFGEDGGIAVWNHGDVTMVRSEIPEERGSRFNDVGVDPTGRVYAGTMPPQGQLYCLETDGRIRSLIRGVDIANGLGFSPDGAGLYFAETHAQTIWHFEYDRGTGDLLNRRRFASSVGTPGHPDGLTVDAEGYVWSARWNGGCVVRHHPEDGRIVDRVDLPARKVSAITFGGSEYQHAYVTTATGGHSSVSEGAGAGSVFRFTPEIGGLPPHRAALTY